MEDTSIEQTENNARAAGSVSGKYFHIIILNLSSKMLQIKVRNHKFPILLTPLIRKCSCINVESLT